MVPEVLSCENVYGRKEGSLFLVFLSLSFNTKQKHFLGVNIDKVSKHTYHLSQPQLIDQILKDIRLTDRDVAAKVMQSNQSVLDNNNDNKPFDGHFHHRSMIGKLNHLERCSYLNIAYAVHQCT